LNTQPTLAIQEVIQHFQELPTNPMSSEACKAHHYTVYDIITKLKAWEESGTQHHAHISKLLRILFSREDWDAPLRPEFFIICTSQGKVIAVGNLIETPNSNFLSLEYLVAAPDPQQKGAGKAALDHVVAQAIKNNKNGIQLESIPSAEGFYTRMGWTPVPDAESSAAGLKKFILQLGASAP
jgi:N-acetylglutamate synthase-like GNAT family acetyltransferase